MRVSLFITCYNDTLFPATGQAVVRLLERLGHAVEFDPEQTCCGQMHYNTGYQTEAMPLLRRFVDIYKDAEAVCVPSSSCVAMMRDHYPKMASEQTGLNRDPGLVRAVDELLPRVYELTELLVNRLGVEDVGAYFPHRVTYHASCHSQRSLHLGDGPLRLLRKVRGIDLVDLPNIDRCCGFGGTFAIKMGDVSAAMLAEKMKDVENTGAEVVTAVDTSCLMHIFGGLHRQRAGVRMAHIAEILAPTESDRLEEAEA
ncbi:MAG TPA: (Fe-S)-binding protein [Acidobacteriaceae bacterium]|nr:(Fe-S)-binding protein [Acidobacteriaceae bacterium]